MKLFVCLVSSNQKLCSEFSRRQSGVFPKASLPSTLKEGVIFNTGVFNSATDHDLLGFLSTRTKKMDAAILLIDSSQEHLIVAVKHSFFPVPLDVPSDLTNCQNFLGQKLPRAFKNFAFLLEQMGASDTEQLAILPVRNFVGNDLHELVRVCTEDTREPTFPDNVTKCLAELRARKRPRRKSNRPEVYIIDDKEKHFRFGPERHAKLGTGSPHTITCEINGNFRFGKRVDSQRHFNVSMGDGDKTHISGDFHDCHGDQHPVSQTTHLNMFCNDFF